MAVTPPEMATLTAEVISAEGKCDAGHKKGDKFTLSCWDPGGLCGFFFHDIFAKLSVMTFGGQYPWAAKDELIVRCSDPVNTIRLKITKP